MAQIAYDLEAIRKIADDLDGEIENLNMKFKELDQVKKEVTDNVQLEKEDDIELFKIMDKNSMDSNEICNKLSELPVVLRDLVSSMKSTSNAIGDAASTMMMN